MASDSVTLEYDCRVLFSALVWCLCLILLDTAEGVSVLSLDCDASRLSQKGHLWHA